MQIRQIQVACEAVQDRLTLRVSTQANEEYRVWITRRFLRELWPHLVGMLAGHLAARPQAVSETSAAAAPTPPSFDQPFKEDNPLFPLGSSPLLASEANLNAGGEGMAKLVFREARERSFTLNLNAELMQALCAMLRKSAEQLAWGLPLGYAAAPAEKATLPADEPKPGLLH